MNYDQFWNEISKVELPIHLVFLCAGNICRSPFAGMMFEKLVSDSLILKEKDFIIESGGFLLQKDVQIHPFTKKALLANSIPNERIDAHTPRTMRKHKESLRNAFSLIVMTTIHRDVLLPAKYREKAILLSEVAVNESNDLPDPALYEDYEKYSALMNQIRTYLIEIVQKLEKTLSKS